MSRCRDDGCDVAKALIAPVLHLVLDRPRIIANIASVVRLCAGTGVALHVCGPLLFEHADKTKWRASLDYLYGTRIHFHNTLDSCLTLLGKQPWLMEVGGRHAPWNVHLAAGDIVVFGPEDASISAHILEAHRERLVTLPSTGLVRSFNLAQCCSALVFEALRQQAAGATTR